MTEFVLTIIGRDRTGVVATLANVVRFHDGDWKRSELAEIAGIFAGVVVVAVGDDEADALLTDLVILREQGVHVTAQPAEGPIERPVGEEIHLRFSGNDTPGVVQRISAALEQLGVSISRMGTVTAIDNGDGPDQFELTTRLSMPDGVEPDAVIDTVNTLAADLGIEVGVHDLTGDSDS